MVGEGQDGGEICYSEYSVACSSISKRRAGADEFARVETVLAVNRDDVVGAAQGED